MDQRLNGLYNSLAYMGVNAVQPPNLTERTYDPTSADSKNFSLGDLWLNTDDQGLWVLLSLAGNIADWREIATGTIASFSTFHTDNGDATVVANAITFNAVSQAGATVTFSGAGSTVRLNVTTGANNTTVGGSSGNTTLTGVNNTAFGFNTLHSLTTGSTNTAMGVNAGAAITTAIQNTLFGANAGAVITTGNQNTLIGRGVGILMTTAANNIGVGSLSLAGLTTGTNNTCMGQGAGLNYTSSESSNIVIGAFNNGVLTESGVTRVGSYSGSSNNFNTFIGFQSGNNTYTIGSAVTNTAVGYQTLRALTTSAGNCAFGNTALAAVTSGGPNNAFGSGALRVCTTGGSNCAMGFLNLGALISGSFNTAIGNGALTNITTGTNNTALGYIAASNLITGSRNIAIGEDSGISWTGAESNNIAIGHVGAPAGSSNTVVIGIPNNGGAVFSNYGDRNIFVGLGAGNFTFTTGSSTTNTAVGYQAMTAVTTAAGNCAFGNTALAAMTSGEPNNAFGSGALRACTTGGGNCAYGFLTLSGVTTGNFNVAVGNSSLGLVTTGEHNTAIGNAVGGQLSTGNRNIVIVGGDNWVGPESSNIVIGNAGLNNESNTIRIGVTGSGDSQQNACFIAGIRGITTGVIDAIPVLIDSAGQLGTISSSIRFKENIKDMGNASSAVMNLRPVSFTYKGQQSAKRQYGLIAEEVEMQLPEIVVYDKNTGQPDTVQYQFLPVLLLNELQRLEKRVKELELQLAS